MGKITIAAVIDAGLDRELEWLARATGRGKEALVAEALEAYAATERQFLSADAAWADEPPEGGDAPAG